MVMAKMGRPKSDNPRSHHFSIRFTDQEYEAVLEYSKKRSQSITRSLLDALDLVMELDQQDKQKASEDSKAEV
jgi:protein-tyrosine-phosphatase